MCVLIYVVILIRIKGKNLKTTMVTNIQNHKTNLIGLYNDSSIVTTHLFDNYKLINRHRSEI